MYSSVADAEYQFRRAKAEADARTAYSRSRPSSEGTEKPSVPAAAAPSIPAVSGGLGGILSKIRSDDLLILAMLFLLFNEKKEDDPLILIVLAALFLS